MGKNPSDTDKKYGDYQRERGMGKVKEDKGGINGDRGDLTLSGEHTI